MSILKDAAEKYLSVLHTGTNFSVSDRFFYSNGNENSLDKGITLKSKNPEITMKILEKEINGKTFYEIKPISPIFNLDMDLDLESDPMEAVQNALEKFYFKVISDKSFDIEELSKTPEDFVKRFSEFAEKSLVVEIVKKKSNQYGVGVGNPDKITIDETFVDDKFTYNLSKDDIFYHGVAHSEKMPAFSKAIEVATNDAMTKHLKTLTNKHKNDFNKDFESKLVENKIKKTKIIKS
jgi:hypothetical protein